MKRKKLSAEVKAARKLDRKAAAMSAHQVKQFGPLFAHMAPTYERDDAYWHTRRNVAEGIERIHQSIGPGMKALRVVKTRFFENVALRVCGRESTERLVAKFQQTYGTSYPQYAYGCWEKVFTGQAVTIALIRIEDPAAPLGCRVEEETYRLDNPPYTVESFRAAFPYADYELLAEPDDGGLFDRVMAAMHR